MNSNMHKFQKISNNTMKSINYRLPKYNYKLCHAEIKTDNKSLLRNDVKYYTIKPCGRKSLLWFTYLNNSFITILKFIDTDEYFSVELNYDNTLSYNNVLLVGYYTIIDKKSYFILDNILNYNDYNYLINSTQYQYQIEQKLKLYNIFFKIINSDSKNPKNPKNHLEIKLPYTTDNYNNVFNNIYNLVYKPYGICINSENKNLGLCLLKNNNYNKNVEAVFNIRAGPGQDMYNLYCINNTNNEQIFHNTSLINSYKLSVYMNNLFRTIRENNNLDLIEESENEDDFENLTQDKYVNLNKSHYFVCRYNNRFKKWIPKQIINERKDKFTVITKKELYLIEKK